MRKLSIIIPAYNEEKRIEKTLSSYLDYFEMIREQKNLDYEILIVINNTTDRTPEIVRKMSRKNKRLVSINLVKGGKGYATIEGFKEVLKKDQDFIGFVDADLATLPEHFYELVEKMGSHHGAIASRYIKGAKIDPKPTVQRLIAKRLFNTMVRSVLFMPYKDTQCGAKVFRRKAIEDSIHEVTMSRWAFDVDLLYAIRKNGYSIREIPTVWSDKEYSTINFWNAGPWMALGVLRLRILNSPLKGFLRLYDYGLNYINKLVN